MDYVSTPTFGVLPPQINPNSPHIVWVLSETLYHNLQCSPQEMLEFGSKSSMVGICGSVNIDVVDHGS